MGGFNFGVAEFVIVTELTLDYCELKQFDGLFERVIKITVPHLQTRRFPECFSSRLTCSGNGR